MSALSRSMGVWLGGLPVYVVITLLVILPAIAVVLWVVVSRGADVPALVIVLLGLQVLLGYLVSGAIIHGAFRRLRGDRPKLGACLATGLSRLGPMLAATFVQCLAVSTLLGVFVFLGIWLERAGPGSGSAAGPLLALLAGVGMIIAMLMLMLRWWLVIPVVVVERPGVLGALRRSSALTDGSRWRIFGLLVLVGMIFGVPSLLFQWVLPHVIGAAPALLAVLLLGLLQVSFNGVLLGVCYHDLRVRVDGIESDVLVAVFD